MVTKVINSLKFAKRFNFIRIKNNNYLNTICTIKQVIHYDRYINNLFNRSLLKEIALFNKTLRSIKKRNLYNSKLSYYLQITKLSSNNYLSF